MDAGGVVKGCNVPDDIDGWKRPRTDERPPQRKEHKPTAAAPVKDDRWPTREESMHAAAISVLHDAQLAAGVACTPAVELEGKRASEILALVNRVRNGQN